MCVLAWPFDGGLVIHDPGNDAILAYNESAAIVWRCLEAGASMTDAASALANTYAIPLDLALRDTAAIVADWDSRGLRQPCPASRPHRARRSSVPDASPPQRARFTIRAHAFELTCTDRRVWDFVLRLLQPFHESGSGPATRLSVALDGGEIRLVVDGDERLTTADPGEAIGGVFQAMLEALHGDPRWLAIFHAGAVLRGDRALLLAGASGSGKSTLTAYLSAHGYAYAADDVAALRAPEGDLVPWPVPQSIKRASWSVLAAFFPALARAPEISASGKDIKYLTAADCAWQQAPRPVVHILFPQFLPEAPAQPVPLRPLEALQLLLQDRVWLGNPPTRETIEAFLAWLSRTPASRLTFGRLEEAGRIVDTLCE